MASFTANRWDNNETVTDFIFLASKITADDDFRDEIKIFLVLGREDMTNLNSVLKSRDNTLSTKIRTVKAILCMYECENWTIKKAENQTINAFKLWSWRRHLSPLDCKEIKPVNPKGNQS